MAKKNREIEVRFLEIDPKKLIQKLRQLNAKDLGEKHLNEIIFYDKELNWQYKEKKIVRLRQINKDIFLTFKQSVEKKADGTIEIEFQVNDLERAKKFLETIGLLAFRYQEKIRHTFKLEGVEIDIDQYPKIPPFVELEGKSERDLKKVTLLLGLDWKKANMDAVRYMIESRYKIPVSKLKYFTFKKIV